MTTSERVLFTIVAVLTISGCTIGVLSIASCSPEAKPAIQPNPDFANCAAEKDKRENDCLIEAGTRAVFDECTARVRKSCIDGGTR